MRKTLLTILLLSAFAAHAQVVDDLFSAIPDIHARSASTGKKYEKIARRYAVLELNRQRLQSLLKQSTDQLTLRLPFEGGMMEMDLKKINVTTPDFTVVEAMADGSTRVNTTYHPGIFYHGKIKGKEKSFATISLSESGVMGVLSDEQGNMTLGQPQDDDHLYLMYRESDLLIPDPIKCFTDDALNAQVSASNKTGPAVKAAGGPGTGASPATSIIKIYIECDYQLYSDKGTNSVNTVNYILGFFNSVTSLYANENLNVQVSQVKVWTNTDPYVSYNTASDILPVFASRMATQNFNGDFAHLLTSRSIGGGIAYILYDPCSSANRYKTAVSGIYTNYISLPTYSWTVNVVTHELGHNLGSNHTHWCGWAGGALDNCYTTEPYPTTSSICSPGPAPLNGGTIMSYCHLTSYGINFANGFGQQPGDKIRSIAAAASCYNNCFLQATATGTPACITATGSAVVTVTNGTAPYTYHWDNGQTGPSISNAAEGTYRVTVADAAGCIATASYDVGSFSSDAAIISPFQNAMVCPGEGKTLTCQYTSGSTPATYQWFKNGSVIPGETNYRYVATVAGAYTVKVNSGTGCTATTLTPTVVTMSSTPAVPVVNTSGALVFCSGENVAFATNSAAGYQWYKDGVQINGATTSGYTATATGQYYVTINNADGCKASSATSQVTVNALPQTPVISTPGLPAICGSNTLTLTSSAASNYQWLKNNIAISGAVNISYTISQTGNYTVKTVNANGCSSTSAVKTVTASSIPSTPVITTSSDTTFCNGNSIQLTSSAASGNQWYKDGIMISNAGSNSSYLASLTGNYTVISTNASGCSSASSLTKTITVISLPAVPVISTTRQPTLCGPGDSLVLTSSASANNNWYKDGVLISGTAGSTYVTTQPGVFSVTTSNASGCSSTSLNTTIVTSSIPLTPTILAGGSTAFCSGSSVALTSSAASGNQWYKDGTAINGAVNPVLNAAAAGNYSVVTTNVSGCSSAPSVMVGTTVNALPPVPSVSTPGLALICGSGATVTLGSSSNTNNQWLKEGAVIAGANGQQYVANTAGNFSVRVTNTAGCTSTSASFSITASAVPAVPQIVAAGATTFCSGHNVLLTSNAPTGNQWYQNGSSISGAHGMTYQAAASGNYSVIVTNASGCSSASSLPVTVTVVDQPAIPVITADGPVAFCDTGKVILHSSAATTNQWFKNNVALTNETHTSYTATQTGLYTVQADNGYGCVSVSVPVSILSITIPPKPVISLNTALGLISSNNTTGNQWYQNNTAITGATGAIYRPVVSGYYKVAADHLGCFSPLSDAFYYLVTAAPVTTTGGNERYKIFPNPVTDKLYVQAANMFDIISLRIIDAQGKLLTDKNFSGNITVNMRAFSAGNYIVLLINQKTKDIQSKRIIKE